MAVYTHLASADLHSLAGAYGLTLREAAPLPFGSANTNYRLETDRGTYVLTLVEDGTRAETTALAELLLHLDAHGIPTTTPVKTRSGDLTTTVGGKPVLLKRYLEGSVDLHPPEAVLEQVGAALARLHAVPPPPGFGDRKLEALWKATPSIVDRLAAESGVDLGARLRALAPEAQPDLPHGLLHGDIYGDNVLVREGRLVALIDFEEALVGPLAFDLGMAAVGLCHTPDGIDRDGVRALVRGYDSVRCLAPDERAALDGMAEYGALLIACWRFWKVRVDTPDPARRAHPLAMVRVAEGIRRSS